MLTVENSLLGSNRFKKHLLSLFQIADLKIDCPKVSECLDNVRMCLSP